MKKMSVLVVVVSVMFVFAQSLLAQGDIEFKLDNYYGPDPQNDQPTAQQNLEDAVAPLLDMFGFLAGGGLYNTADVHGIMGFDVGVKLTAMRVGDDQLPFFPDLSTEYQYGPLSAENIIPLPMLHAGVGLFGNLEVMGRFFTYPMGSEGSAEGNVTLIGLGAKYGLLQNFALPKVAVVAAYHYLTMPDEFDFASVNSISGAVVVSKSFPIVSVYGGLGVDYTTLTVDFPDPLPDPDPNKFSKTNFRGNVGLRLTPIPFLFINVDYNFGAVEGLSAGAGISIR